MVQATLVCNLKSSIVSLVWSWFLKLAWLYNVIKNTKFTILLFLDKLLIDIDKMQVGSIIALIINCSGINSLALLLVPCLIYVCYWGIEIPVSRSIFLISFLNWFCANILSGIFFHMNMNWSILYIFHRQHSVIDLFPAFHIFILFC